MKRLYFLLYLVLIASTTHSQSLLLDKHQNSFTVEGGIAGGHNVTSIGLGIGSTFQGIFDVGAGISRAYTKLDNYWVLGQGASVKILSETGGDNVTSSLSLNQAFSFAEGIKALSLGGGFSLMTKFGIESAFLLSFGYNRILILSPHNEGYNSATVRLTLAIGDRKSIFHLTPFATLATENRSTFGIVIGNSSIVTGSDQESFTNK